MRKKGGWGRKEGAALSSDRGSGRPWWCGRRWIGGSREGSTGPHQGRRRWRLPLPPRRRRWDRGLLRWFSGSWVVSAREGRIRHSSCCPSRGRRWPEKRRRTFRGGRSPLRFRTSPRGIPGNRRPPGGSPRRRRRNRGPSSGPPRSSHNAGWSEVSLGLLGRDDLRSRKWTLRSPPVAFSLRRRRSPPPATKLPSSRSISGSEAPPRRISRPQIARGCSLSAFATDRTGRLPSWTLHPPTARIPHFPSSTAPGDWSSRLRV